MDQLHGARMALYGEARAHRAETTADLVVQLSGAFQVIDCRADTEEGYDGFARASKTIFDLYRARTAIVDALSIVLRSVDSLAAVRCGAKPRTPWRLCTTGGHGRRRPTDEVTLFPARLRRAAAAEPAPVDFSASLDALTAQARKGAFRVAAREPKKGRFVLTNHAMRGRPPRPLCRGPRPEWTLNRMSSGKGS